MPDDLTSVQIAGIVIEPGASVDRLCGLLIECEKAQRRYQWTSGLLLLTLITDPETPKKAADFVDWLGHRTGMVLSQSEVAKRISVYRFYSRFPSEAGIIDLIERSGVHIAYRATKVIDQRRPEQAREVLAACVESPETANMILREFGESQRRLKRRVKVNQTMFTDARKSLTAAKRKFDDENEWVSLDTALNLLDELEKKTR